MHPADCPHVWEYEHNPRRGELATRAAALLLSLRRKQLDSAALAADSRPVHHRLFQNLTPAGCEYFAGHYRGEDFRCLRYCPVGIAGDPRVGAAPETVLEQMARLAKSTQEAIVALNQLARPPHERLVAAVALACQILELALRIHPYVNGNGHAARFILLAILGRYDYWPARWTTDPRPGHPDYVNMIVAYRNGNPRPLEEFILKSIIGL